jgi:hypothetical protein
MIVLGRGKRLDTIDALRSTGYGTLDRVADMMD